MSIDLNLLRKLNPMLDLVDLPPGVLEQAQSEQREAFLKDLAELEQRHEQSMADLQSRLDSLEKKRAEIFASHSIEDLTATQQALREKYAQLQQVFTQTQATLTSLQENVQQKSRAVIQAHGELQQLQADAKARAKGGKTPCMIAGEILAKHADHAVQTWNVQNGRQEKVYDRRINPHGFPHPTPKFV